MTKLNEVYRCNICGNIVELNHSGKGQLVCCGQPMELLKENSIDAALEKHVPVIIQEDNKIVIKIGEIEHPMEEKHFIEWIELIADEISFKKFLKPGKKPEAEFYFSTIPQKIIAKAYCNVHGFWKNK